MSAYPQRMCSACRKRRPQVELLRYCRRRDGEVVPAGRNPVGRSAYLCPEGNCLDRAVTRRLLSRALGRDGRCIRAVSEAASLRAATEIALDRRIEVLSKSAASAPARLPRLPRLQQLRSLVAALRPIRSA